jgi:ribosomal subunit interface protein
MQIIIQSVGFKESEHLTAFVHEKLSKIDHQVHNIIRADVTLFKDGAGEHGNHYCEIKLEVPGHDPFVKKNSDNYEQAIAAATDSLHELLRRNKDKEISGRHDSASLN